MKPFYALLLLILTVVAGYLFIEFPEQVLAAAHPDCYTINVNLDVEGKWPGGRVTLQCNGRQNNEEGSDGRCPGQAQTIAPGETVALEGCNCLKDDCLRIDEAALPRGCGLKDANYCGMSNASAHDKEVKIHCQGGDEEPEEPSNPGDGDDDGDGDDGDDGDDDDSDGRGGRCVCTYEEQCTKNGKEGTRTCNGEETENGCGFSNNCNTNCSDCNVGEEPENPEEPEQPETPENPENPEEPEIPPVNRCNQSCESDKFCEDVPGATDNCTKCLPSSEGKTCQPPPGQPPVVTPPKIIPKVIPTPTPRAYNPAMCKCDGLEPSLIVPGLTSTITAKAYIAGADTKAAEMRGVTFTLIEGNSTVGRVLERSAKLEMTTTSSTASRVNYAGSWQVKIPDNLTPGSIYRVFATINCGPRKIAALELRSPDTAVLGATTKLAQQGGILAGVTDWLQSLFGIRPKDDTSNKVIPKEDVEDSAGTNPTTITPEQPTSPTNEELKLRTVQPATIMNKSCTSLTFQAK